METVIINININIYMKLRSFLKIFIFTGYRNNYNTFPHFFGGRVSARCGIFQTFFLFLFFSTMTIVDGQ